MTPIRIGVLGAATILDWGLIQPAREVADVAVTALAARDPTRAREVAAKHGIAKVHDSYAALIADPEIDAIYNPLPNGLHGFWTIAALKAGKHVLCEKPFAANAAEAEAVAAVARRSGRVCMEAVHYRYHALMRRMQEIIASGELGAMRHIDAWFCITAPPTNIRFDLSLAGGALMDTGFYTVNLLRTLGGAEPVVRSARAKLLTPGVDHLLRADFDFPDGRTGSIKASLRSGRFQVSGARVVGSDATMKVVNPYLPQVHHRLTVRSSRGARTETVPAQPTTYAAQLKAFAGAVLRGEPFPTGVDDAIANMRVIDACYAAAGLPRREPTPVL